MTDLAHFGLVEGGGTKFVLGIAEASRCGQHRRIVARHRLPTTSPDETLTAAQAWFAAHPASLEAIGIACFGPLQLDRSAPDWGHITSTTKPGWSGADVAGMLAAGHKCPVGIETDVNAAALAEARWGAGMGHNSLLYLTVGTGVGGGFVNTQGLLHGLTHPEMGHIRLPRHPDDQAFAGACPFHGDCLEGLASGPAIIARWGASLSELPAGHPARAIIAWYLGQACVTFQAVLQPARIVLGGGVMAAPGLIDLVRAETAAAGRGYFPGDPTQLITLPALGGDSGLLGALAVALAAL